MGRGKNKRVIKIPISKLQAPNKLQLQNYKFKCFKFCVYLGFVILDLVLIVCHQQSIK